jgi:DNA polymerase-3 subunit delta
VFEGTKRAGAVECFDDGIEGAARLIRETLSAAGWGSEPDALAYLAEALSLDRMLLRSELDKLVLYLGKGSKGSTLTRAQAASLVGDSGAIEADEIANAVAAGDLRQLDRLLTKAMESAPSWTGVVGATLRLFQRLAAAAEGAGPSWGRGGPYEQRLQAQLEGWQRPQLIQALQVLAQAEADTRTTGLPEAPGAQRALFDVAALKGARR